MDEPHGLTADQIAKLASMVSTWAPRSGKVDEMVFQEDAPDVILDIRVESQSGDRIPLRVRIRHEWLDKVAKAELESHTHRVLTIIEDRKLGVNGEHGESKTQGRG
jgi:hypothetical protein